MAQQIRFGALCVVCAALARSVKRGMQNRDTARQERKSNNNTPAYSMTERAGVALRSVWLPEGRCRTFGCAGIRDSHKGAKRRDGPINGLYGGLLFLGYAPPCWTRAQNSRLRAVGRRTSGGRMRGSIGT